MQPSLTFRYKSTAQLPLFPPHLTRLDPTFISSPTLAVRRPDPVRPRRRRRHLRLALVRPDRPSGRRSQPKPPRKRGGVVAVSSPPAPMARRRVLLFLKPFDVFPPRPLSGSSSPTTPPPLGAANPKILSYLDDRCRVHKDTIDLCKSVLQSKPLDWVSVQRNHLSNPIRDVDLVITVGGDGTLLRASHFLDSSIPILGVNSDPTRSDEVDELTDEFDARRSTGYLCAATARNFEQILDATLDGTRHHSELSRISLKLNGFQLPTYALNDILVSHPCPASVSRFSFRKRSTIGESSHLINCRSSGLRVATATGSTAAMLSAGGFMMPISSRELQYMIREPISPTDADKPLLHGLVKQEQNMLVVWYNQEGAIYVDGSHVMYTIQHGDTLEISSDAPVLKVVLPEYLLNQASS